MKIANRELTIEKDGVPAIWRILTAKKQGRACSFCTTTSASPAI